MKLKSKCARCDKDTDNLNTETGLLGFGERTKLWVSPALCNGCWDKTVDNVCSGCDMEAACNGPAIEQCYKELSR